VGFDERLGGGATDGGKPVALSPTFADIYPSAKRSHNQPGRRQASRTMPDNALRRVLRRTRMLMTTSCAHTASAHVTSERSFLRRDLEFLGR
jgi:hypothetical protein